MTIEPEDEYPHTHPDDAPPGWQENCFLMGWDDNQGIGFYVHVERFPHRGVQETKAMVVTAASTVSAVLDGPLGESFIGVSVEWPFQTVDVDIRGNGHLRDAGGRLGYRRDGSTPFEIAVQLEGASVVADWGPLLEEMGIDGTERNHYEQGMIWSGMLRLGDRTLGASGRCVRDHTWGVRQYGGISGAWWTPACFDDGSYSSGVAVRVGDLWVGGGLTAPALGSDEPVVIHHGHLVEIEGVADFEAYKSATVTAGARQFSGEVITHLPVPYPGFGGDAAVFQSSEGFATVTDGEGRQGFATFELSRVLRPDEAESL